MILNEPNYIYLFVSVLNSFLWCIEHVLLDFYENRSLQKINTLWQPFSSTFNLTTSYPTYHWDRLSLVFRPFQSHRHPPYSDSSSLSGFLRANLRPNSHLDQSFLVFSSWCTLIACLLYSTAAVSNRLPTRSLRYSKVVRSSRNCFGNSYSN